ncbi:MAG: hypothetical protein FWF12_00635 [Betaproteobacteria bacterium]|nr:hypothetical protein [Betaproteobacteria bacterium]
MDQANENFQKVEEYIGASIRDCVDKLSEAVSILTEAYSGENGNGFLGATIVSAGLAFASANIIASLSIALDRDIEFANKAIDGLTVDMKNRVLEHFENREQLMEKAA